MSPVEKTFRKPLDLFIVMFGCWTVFAHLAVYGGHSFTALVTFSFLPLLFAIALLLYLWREVHVPTMDREICSYDHIVAVGIWFIPAVVMAIGFRVAGFHLVFWLLACAALGGLVFLLCRSGSCDTLAAHTGGDTKVALVTDAGHAKYLYALMLVVCLIMIFTNTPSADDTYYVNAAITAQQYPDLALLSFDGIHGDLSVPSTHIAHRSQVYELFVAVLSQISSFSVKDVYYVLMPLWFSVLWVCANYLFCGVFSDRYRLVSMGLLLFVVHFWAEQRLAYGNFSTTQLYLGKIILMSVVVPALIYYAYVFARSPGIKSFLFLWLCSVAAIGLSSTGIILVCITLFLIGLPLLLIERRWRLVPCFAALAIYPVLVALRVKYEVDLHGGIGAEGDVLSIDVLLGSLPHVVMSLGFLLLLPLFLSKTANDKRLLYGAGYITCCTFFLLSPWSSEFIGHFTLQMMSWRVYWAIPVPVLLAISVSHSGYFLFAGRKYWRRVYFFSFCVIFAYFGALNLMPGGRTIFPMTGYKQNPYHRMGAEAILPCVKPEDLLLAPEGVAQVMSSYVERPGLVGVGFNYVSNLQPFISPEEVSRRQQLMAYVSNRSDWGLTAQTLGEALVKQEVTAVAVFEHHPDVAALHQWLPLAGFPYAWQSQNMVLWLKQKCDPIAP